ncbi:MAG TPA: WbuC family cupin fold metalloprotein [Polyangiaceae bacterium]|nr:WbuC family cupin fold metalloprotein [Polyangiaceae bacterium]
MADFLRALPPPSEDLTVIDDTIIDAAVRYSRTSPRKRVMQPLHKRPEEPLQRMLNAMQPGSYARPHRHADPRNWEVCIVLRGKLLFIAFHDDGRVKTSVELAAGSSRLGVDLEPGAYHTTLALVADTVSFEVKHGPYAPDPPSAFAPWAPAEGDAGVAEYVASLLAAHERRG